MDDGRWSIVHKPGWLKPGGTWQGCRRQNSEYLENSEVLAAGSRGSYSRTGCGGRGQGRYEAVAVGVGAAAGTWAAQAHKYEGDQEKGHEAGMVSSWGG
jgi:hypothetical protein